MIEVRQLTKRYGSRVAVDALTFDVRPRMVTGFLGPNGSGKSTTCGSSWDWTPPTRGLPRSAAVPTAGCAGFFHPRPWSKPGAHGRIADGVGAAWCLERRMRWSAAWVSL